MLYHLCMKTFDTFLNKCIRTLLVVNIIIMLTIGGFFLQPVFAAVDGVFRVPVLSSDESKFVDKVLLTYSSGSFSQGYWVSDDSSIIAAAFYKDGSNTKVALVSTSSAICRVSTFNNNVYSNSTSNNLSYSIQFDGSTYYYHNSNLGSPDLLNTVAFSDFNSALAACVSYLLNPSDEPSVSYEGFRLPAGYAAAIQGSNISFDLAVDMPEYSSIKQWAYSTQRYGLESSLPSVASFDYDYGTRIIWSVVGDTNLLGEGYHASASLSQSVGSGYLMLVNPTYYGSTASIMSADMFNGAVTLSNVSGVTSIRLYSLGSYIGSGGITSDITTGGAVHAGSVVSSGGAFFIDNGDGTFTPINSLPDYGDTSVDGSNSGLIAKFRALLDGFVESIESLLIAPVSYIQRIIAAGQTFFTWLSGLWTWLPADVSGILTAVLYVMAVVGALKLLWR